MANNELSGPAVLTFLAKHLLINKNKYTYRFILIPETIGSRAYLSIYKEYLIVMLFGMKSLK
jgi:aminopeptidase-like protein